MNRAYRIRIMWSLIVFGTTTAMTIPALLANGIAAAVAPLYAIVLGLGVGAITLIVLLQSVKNRHE